jgi:hypothetical protein
MNKNYLIKRKHKEELLGFKRRVELSEIKGRNDVRRVDRRIEIGGGEKRSWRFRTRREEEFLGFCSPFGVEDSVNVVFVLQVEVNFNVQTRETTRHSSRRKYSR